MIREFLNDQKICRECRLWSFCSNAICQAPTVTELTKMSLWMVLNDPKLLLRLSIELQSLKKGSELLFLPCQAISHAKHLCIFSPLVVRNPQMIFSHVISLLCTKIWLSNSLNRTQWLESSVVPWSVSWKYASAYHMALCSPDAPINEAQLYRLRLPCSNCWSCEVVRGKSLVWPTYTSKLLIDLKIADYVTYRVAYRLRSQWHRNSMFVEYFVSNASKQNTGRRLTLIWQLSAVLAWLSLSNWSGEWSSYYTIWVVCVPTRWDMAAIKLDSNLCAPLLIVARVDCLAYTRLAPTLWFTHRSAWVVLVWAVNLFGATRRSHAKGM